MQAAVLSPLWEFQKVPYFANVGEVLFHTAMAALRTPHVASANWYSEVSPSEKLHPALLLLGGSEGVGMQEFVFHHTGHGAAIKISKYKTGQIYCSVASLTRSLSHDLLLWMKELIPPRPGKEEAVNVQFWYRSPSRIESTTRETSVPSWEEVKGNYTASVRAVLDPWMAPDFRPSSAGRLVLWRGEPGTGKTWALRAMMNQWREWATFHYVTDPEQFFGSSADYMFNVLLDNEDEDTEKWRLLVLEDTGEMLAADAKMQTGQALSRLLNVVDGLIGQGLKIVVLITTNEEIGKLHPAVIRPGRCLMNLEFGELTEGEAATWMHAHKLSVDTLRPKPKKLAELYALTQGIEMPEQLKLGFTRGD